MARLTAAAIAAWLNRPLQGQDGIIAKPADLSDCGPGDLVWVKSYTPERLNILETQRPTLAICDPETARLTTVSHIVTTNPRLDFIKVIKQFFWQEPEPYIHPSAIIEPGAQLGVGVSIGAYARIGPQVVVGDHCRIGSGVAIEGRVSLGRGCVIKANSVLGGQGFGFEYDGDGNPVHFPHLGQIIIEDEVWLGACTTVEIATLGVTRICRGAKVDDLVQVGHNVTVGPNTLIMANSIICGGVKIGEGCWIAPNSVIKGQLRIGNRVTVGLGAVVLRDVADDLVVAGVPAKPLKPKA